jgi:hypothetical protein
MTESLAGALPIPSGWGAKRQLIGEFDDTHLP